jgi:hypothetical protein
MYSFWKLFLLLGLSFALLNLITSPRQMRINEDVLSLSLYIYIYIVWPSLWPSGQSSWLQIQRSGFDSLHYQIFWEVVGLERGPLSLVRTIEELLERKNSCCGLESRYGYGNPSRWPCGTFYPQKLALTSLTSGDRSVGIVRSRTQATEFFICIALSSDRIVKCTKHP